MIDFEERFEKVEGKLFQRIWAYDHPGDSDCAVIEAFQDDAEYVLKKHKSRYSDYQLLECYDGLYDTMKEALLMSKLYVVISV